MVQRWSTDVSNSIGEDLYDGINQNVPLNHITCDLHSGSYAKELSNLTGMCAHCYSDTKDSLGA